jgi:hypothetical protein
MLSSSVKKVSTTSGIIRRSYALARQKLCIEACINPAHQRHYISMWISSSISRHSLRRDEGSIGTCVRGVRRAGVLFASSGIRNHWHEHWRWMVLEAGGRWRSTGHSTGLSFPSLLSFLASLLLFIRFPFFHLLANPEIATIRQIQRESDWDHWI